MSSPIADNTNRNPQGTGAGPDAGTKRKTSPQHDESESSNGAAKRSKTSEGSTANTSNTSENQVGAATVPCDVTDAHKKSGGAEKRNQAEALMMLCGGQASKNFQSNRSQDVSEQPQVGQFQEAPIPSFVGPTVHNNGGFTTQYSPNTAGLGPSIQHTLFTNPDGSMVPVQIIQGPNGQALLVQQISLPQAAQAQEQLRHKAAQQQQQQVQQMQGMQNRHTRIDNRPQGRGRKSAALSYADGSKTPTDSEPTDGSDELPTDTDQSHSSSGIQMTGSSSSDPGMKDTDRQKFKRERNRLHARKSRERKKKTFAALHGRAAQLTGLITLLLEAAIKYVPQDLCAVCIDKCQAMQIERWTEPSPTEKLKPR